MRGRHRHFRRVLTEVEEHFCREFVAHGVQSRAYVAAFPEAATWPSSKRSQYGRRLLAMPEVVARLAELRGTGAVNGDTDAAATSSLVENGSIERQVIWAASAGPYFYASVASRAGADLELRIAAFRALLAVDPDCSVRTSRAAA